MKKAKSKKIISILSIITIITLLIVPMASCEHTPWDCPGCGRTGNTGNYCGGCAHPAPWMTVSDSEVCQFGHGNTQDDKLEWIVLDTQDDKILLISKYILTYYTYSGIDTFMNTFYINTHFYTSERASILDTVLENGKTCKLFLLSSDEFFKYFPDDASRICKPLPSVKEDAIESSRYWWLRSPGTKSNTMAVVSGNGTITSKDPATNRGVRPAMWITLDAFQGLKAQ